MKFRNILTNFSYCNNYMWFRRRWFQRVFLPNYFTISEILQQRRSRESLGFWLANSSELLNFFKQDIDLSLLSRGIPQQILAGCVEQTFEMLGTVLKNSLDSTLNSIRDAFLDDRSASRMYSFFLWAD